MKILDRLGRYVGRLTFKGELLLLAVLMVIFLVLGMLAGCSSLWRATKSAAAPAGGAAAGALVGSLAPPAGPIIGAAIGAAAADSIEENASLRSGETMGEDALEKELRRWQVDASVAGARASAAEGAYRWIRRFTFWFAVSAGVWFLWRNRHNLRDRGVIHGLIHAVIGGSKK